MTTLASAFLFEFRGGRKPSQGLSDQGFGSCEPKEVTGIAFYDGLNLRVSSATRAIVHRYLSTHPRAGSDQPRPPRPHSSISDAWKVLGLRPDAPKEAVVASYKSLCKTWHPDAWPPELSAAQKKAIDDKMKEITEAYNLLREQGFT